MLCKYNLVQFFDLACLSRSFGEIDRSDIQRYFGHLLCGGYLLCGGGGAPLRETGETRHREASSGGDQNAVRGFCHLYVRQWLKVRGKAPTDMSTLS